MSKLDGFRMSARIEGGRVQLLTRTPLSDIEGYSWLAGARLRDP